MMKTELIVNKGYLRAKPVAYPNENLLNDLIHLIPTPEVKRICDSLLIETRDAYYILKSRKPEIGLIQQEFLFTNKSRIQANMNNYHLQGECYRKFVKANIVIQSEEVW